MGFDHIRSLAAALTAEGYATWSLEYRRLGDPGGGWPGTLEDVASGADHLSEVSRAHPLDPDRVVAVGHSAGGHLALWLAGRHRLAPGSPLHAARPLRLHGVVSLAGITDLRAAAEGRSAATRSHSSSAAHRGTTPIAWASRRRSSWCRWACRYSSSAVRETQSCRSTRPARRRPRRRELATRSSWRWSKARAISSRRPAQSCLAGRARSRAHPPRAWLRHALSLRPAPGLPEAAGHVGARYTLGFVPKHTCGSGRAPRPGVPRAPNEEAT